MALDLGKNRQHHPLMSLEGLKNKGCDELDGMFAAALVPTPDELEGAYDGLLLTGNLPPAPRHFPIAKVQQPWWPWKGKVFYTSTDSRRGHGANRLVAGPIRRERWRFETAVGPSRFDGRDALLLDYDLPGNPLWLRRGVIDELRKVKDGLYLGKGGIVVLGQTRFVFLWALQKPNHA